MGHPIRGIRGSKPRFGPSIAQVLAEEAEAQRRKDRKLRKSAKPAGTAQSRRSNAGQGGG
jgi:hypothetical protein